MILKFYWTKSGCWVMEDGICRIKHGYCRFVTPESIDMSTTMLDGCTQVELRDPDKVLVALRCGAEECHDKTCTRIDWNWLVDKVHEQKPTDPGEFKWVTVEFRNGHERSGLIKKTYIFRDGTRIYSLNDAGKTIEKL